MGPQFGEINWIFDMNSSIEFEENASENFTNFPKNRVSVQSLQHFRLRWKIKFVELEENEWEKNSLKVVRINVTCCN